MLGEVRAGIVVCHCDEEGAGPKESNCIATALQFDSPALCLNNIILRL